jgi:hypothetical protein
MVPNLKETKMKKIKIIIALAIIANIFTLSSCKKFIDEDINIDPNNPEDVPMNVLLPGIEANLGYSYGSDLSRYPSLWIQTMAGINNQHLQYDNYSLNESDVNNMWYFNLYGGAMSDLDILIRKAASTGSPHYGGIAKILMANALGTCTDLWGDIPYSEAFQGRENLTPKYDSQESIYGSIQSLLDQAIADLSSSTSNFLPGGDDLIYGGDLASWIALANSLKARYYIHLIKKDPGASANALAAIAAGAIADVTGSAKLFYGENSNELNPYYQFFTNDRPGDAGIGKTIVDIMNGTNDPRRAAYFTTDANCTPDTCYSGAVAGSGDAATSYLGPFYNSPAAPIYFMTFAEVKFIEAEAQLRSSNAVAAAAAYNAAVTASLDEYGIADAAFITANASETDLTITLDKIFTQKYVHMFGQGYEGYADWRRSHDATHPNGIPALTAAVGNVTNGVIPRRLPYPNSERLQNGANVAAATSSQGGASLLNRVWWDVP